MVVVVVVVVVAVTFTRICGYVGRGLVVLTWRMEEGWRQGKGTNLSNICRSQRGENPDRNTLRVRRTESRKRDEGASDWRGAELTREFSSMGIPQNSLRI